MEDVAREAVARADAEKAAKAAREKKAGEKIAILQWLAEFAGERGIELSEELKAASEKKTPPSDKATLEFVRDVFEENDASTPTVFHAMVLRRISNLYFKHLKAEARAENPEASDVDVKALVFEKLDALPAARNAADSDSMKEKFEVDNVGDIYRELFNY